jgi:hypothetical protein
MGREPTGDGSGAPQVYPAPERLRVCGRDHGPRAAPTIVLVQPFRAGSRNRVLGYSKKRSSARIGKALAAIGSAAKARWTT